VCDNLRKLPERSKAQLHPEGTDGRRGWVSNFLSSLFLHPSLSFDYPFGFAQDAYGVEFRNLPEQDILR
jgi:hypothetical protein